MNVTLLSGELQVVDAAMLVDRLQQNLARMRKCIHSKRPAGNNRQGKLVLKNPKTEMHG